MNVFKDKKEEYYFNKTLNLMEISPHSLRHFRRRNNFKTFKETYYFVLEIIAKVEYLQNELYDAEPKDFKGFLGDYTNPNLAASVFLVNLYCIDRNWKFNISFIKQLSNVENNLKKLKKRIKERVKLAKSRTTNPAKN